MKKQINPTIKAHLIRGAFYLLLLIAVCAIPFALAQRNAIKRGMANPASNPNMIAKSAAAPSASENAGSPLLPYDVRTFPGRHVKLGEIPTLLTPTTGPKFRILLQPRLPRVVLYDQYDNAGTNATSSQDFETDLDTFDDFTADDFVVPAGQTWNVSEVDVQGTYDGFTGPAIAFHVFFYQDSGGLPGTQVYAAMDQPYTGGPTDFIINLSTAAVLPPGTYWVSVQCRMDFGVGGQWYWQDRTVQSNNGAAWQNPGGGFGICTTWGRRGDPAGCNIDPGVPDQVYRLVGTTGGGTPTPTPTASPTSSPSCTPIVINGSIATGDPTQTDRLFRSGIPQTCPATTTCAIFGDAQPRRYDAYTLTNTTGSTQCVHIDTNTACTGNQFIFIGAYLGSFDPNNICTNWIGDAGSSPNPEQAFDVDVDDGQTLVVVVSEVNFSGCPSYTVTITGLCPPPGTPSPTPTATATSTGTPSPTPTCTPGGGTPGPWTQAAPVAIDHYGGFMDSDGTFAYEGGGYSFSVGDNITEFGRFDPVANTWTPLAAVPDLNNAEASGVYAPNVNKLFVFGGEEVTFATVVNTTRIYDIATDTWSTGAPMPDLRAFMASGYFNGKIYLVGGYSTGNITPAFLQTWEYDPVADTFATKTSIPAAAGFGGAGSGVINGHLYVAGGRDANNIVIATTWDYDIAADTWTQRADLPSANNVPGSAVIGGQLWVFGGGNPFTGSAAMPFAGKQGVRVPDTTNTLDIYDPVTDSWSVGPSLNQVRSFPAGTDVGNTAVAVGGYTGIDTTTSVEINVTSGGVCPSPSPTATATATATGTPLVTATPTATATPLVTATPTATATETPRSTPTPRPRPTPAPRPSP